VAQPDPNDIQAFLEVVRHGSFRGAARSLQWSKSAVSQRVASLEAELGARLLARTTRSVKLTDIGASYHREVAAAFEALREADARVRHLQSRPSGKLRITAPIELGQSALAGPLSHYALRYPEVELEVLLTDRVVSLVEEGFDLAVRVSPSSSPGLIVRTLSSPQQLGIYASPVYLKRHGTIKHPSELAAHRCLTMSGSQTPSSWPFLVEGKLRRVNIRAHVMVNSFQILATLASAGVGVAMLPTRHSEQGVAAGTLKQLLKPFAPEPRAAVLVYPSNRNISPALRAMLDTLVEHFDTEPYAPRG
jgi:DNA-binding transcriptional LysR family regulator